jgi:hypothetical protein
VVVSRAAPRQPLLQKIQPFFVGAMGIFLNERSSKISLYILSLNSYGLSSVSLRSLVKGYYELVPHLRLHDIIGRVGYDVVNMNGNEQMMNGEKVHTA